MAFRRSRISGELIDCPGDAGFSHA